MLKPAMRITALVLCLLAPVLLVQSGTYKNDKTEIPETLNVLVLGKDDSSSLADVVMLVNLNVTEKSLSILQIPRDTYIDLGDGNYKKINGASKLLGGDGELCRKLSESLGINIGGYVSFDSELVRKMVDAIGGVEVFVPADMDYDDPYQELSIHLKKGKQKLDGKEAVGFVRYRQGYLRADIGRIDAQKIFLSAFAKTALEGLSVKDILPLSKLALRYIRTDLPINRLVALGVAMKDITADRISLATMPGEEVQSQKSGAWFYILSKSGCEEILKRIGAESGFDASHIYSDKSRAEFEEIYNREIKARIYNAAEIDGEGIEIKPK